MAKDKFPTTQAIRFLKQHQIDYQPFLYDYEAHGGTAHSAACLGADEHLVIKTIVLQTEAKQGLVVLMHGDKHISTRQLARDLGLKHIEPAAPEQANKWSGYMVGGTSPFGLKTALPVYAEASIFALPAFYINGGKRGFLIKTTPAALQALGAQPVSVAVDA
ncbi:MAG: aminoacyl-tRNA deacylase [Neisseriaceae bacterium]|nr:aminoacyl-tRNA deacylase [Neisseriaceae bacterium]